MPAAAQVFWNADYDSTFPFCSYAPWVYARSPGSLPTANIAITNNGAAQGNFFTMTVDSSQSTAAYMAGCSQVACAAPVPPVVFDQAHAFIKFDISVSKLRPVYVGLEFQCVPFGGGRSLVLRVQPAAVGSFETFLLPMTTVITNSNNCGTNFSTFPTAFQFYIFGDPANTDTTWPPAADNTVAVDNVSYILQPVLSMTVNDEAVTLSWSTNATGFVLQQSLDLSHWGTVTNTPVLTNGASQVVLSLAAPQRYFRLNGP